MLIDGAQLEAPAAPLDDLLRAGLASVPDEVAIVSAVRQLSWRQLEDAAARLARGYLELGLAPGERIGYKAPEEVVFLDQMPLNPTGKIDRVGLKRMAEDHLHPHGLGDAAPAG